MTAEAIRALTAAGLEEAAVAVFRTLLELEVNLTLVLDDDTNEAAKRLAAFHFVNGRRHFSKLFGNPDMRERLQGDADHWEWSRATSRRFKEFFESDEFDDVRDEVAGAQYWHGLPNVESAFDAAGMIKDYVGLYDTFSPFSHGSNVDHDWADVEHGRPVLKALPQRDPARTMTMLKGLGFRLIQVYERYLADRGQPEYQPELAARGEDGDEFTVPAVTALSIELAVVFGAEGIRRVDGADGR